MKISYSWLKDYLPFDLSSEDASKHLTACGLEVEGIEVFESIRGGLKGVVVGEVMSKEKHPNADKLSLTKVNIGETDLLSIVCGAPNVEAGQKVLVACVGSTLYPKTGEPIAIKKSKIRGELSEGMICAEDELGLGESHDGILVLDSSAKIGTPASEYLNLKNDLTFEIGLTPNRVDAASHIGVARDLIAVVNSIQNEKHKLIYPKTKNSSSKNSDRAIAVQVIDTDACPRYTGITISGIEVKDSPDWLKQRLKSIGLKPINNIVDITNFVLHEFGQPLHAFDADKIVGKKVLVKKLAEGTKFITLDGLDRKLSASDLMICNEAGGMCIAGVFGGFDSGVKPETKNIFIESAYFSPSGIRRTAKLHTLKTEASFRYERGADPSITVIALQRAIDLILQVCPNAATSEISDHYPKAVSPSKVDFSLTRFEKMSGIKIPIEKIKSILSDLEIKVLGHTEDRLDLEIPTFKPDVQREADVDEEILRIYGYDQIVPGNKLRSAVQYSIKPNAENLKSFAGQILSDNGFFEIITHSLVRKANNATGVDMLNPLSEEMGTLRTSLLQSGLRAIAYNRNRKNSDLKFFEFGRSYHISGGELGKREVNSFNEVQHLCLFVTGNIASEHWKSKSEKVDFYFLKNAVDKIFQRLGIVGLQSEETMNQEFSSALVLSNQTGALAHIGKVSKSMLDAEDVNAEVFYADLNWDLILKACKKRKLEFKELSKYPEVRRDLSMLLDRSTKFHELQTLSFETERKLLRSINLFDVYKGEKIEPTKISYALSFFLQDENATLTDKEVDKVMGKLEKAFETKFNAVIRRS